MFLNMKLLAQHGLNGFGGMGEGMALQRSRDGRRVLWLAHESAPKNFTAVDVSDPRQPKIVGIEKRDVLPKRLMYAEITRRRYPFSGRREKPQS